MQDKTEKLRIHRTRGAKRRRRLRIALFTLIGVVVLILALAGGSYLWFSKTVDVANQRIEKQTDTVQALQEAPPTTLVEVKEPEDAINIMLVGNDSRADDGTSGGRSDTLILMHVDPTNNYLSLLSIPRDLYVDIPGHPKNKINAAYAFGGPALAIKTVKNLTGVNITKYAEVGFQTFQELVDSLGGVYVDVDRQYTLSSKHMDIHPGYQLMSGSDALLFSRFRYDSNMDFGRQRRQQRVLAALREQAMGWNLPTKLPGLISTTMKGMTTNLTAADLLKLANFAIGLDGSRIRQVFISGTTPTIDGRSVVVATTEELKSVVTQFLTPPTDEAVSLNAYQTDVLAAVGSTPESVALFATTTSTGSSTETSTQASSGTIVNAGTWKTLQKSVSFPLQAPTFVPDGYSYSSTYPANGGTYKITVGDDTKPCVRVMYRYGNRDLYVAVSATTWLDAPLTTKGVEVEKNGVVYHVVGTNSRTDHIWWKNGDVLYFISNTLMYSVKPPDLLKMAESMVPVSQ